MKSTLLLLATALPALAAQFHLQTLEGAVYNKHELNSFPQFNIPTDNEDSIALLNSGSHGPPPAPVAATHARTLVKRESLVNVNTVYQDGEDSGIPVSFVEYYADCGDGNPIILAVNIGTSFRNIAKGSIASLSIRVGDHPLNEHVDPKYPGSRPGSVPGSPRLNLRGKFVDLTLEEIPAAEECFLKKHKDAAWWTPGNPIHGSHWTKFVVDNAYYIGGFGDTGYIGKIDGPLYRNAGTLDDEDHERTENADFWDGELKNHQHEFGEQADVALMSSTVLSRVRRLLTHYKKISLTMFGNGEKNVDVDDLATPEDGLHVGDLYDSVSTLLEKRDDSSISIKELSKENIDAIIDQLQTRLEDIRQYTEDFLASHPAHSSFEKNTKVKIFKEVDEQLTGYTQHPLDKFHAKQLREQAESGWAVAKSEDVYRAHHPGVEVPDDVKNKLLVFVDGADQ